MTTPTAWAHLPNARLIDALIAALPTCPQATRDAARDAARAATRAAARDAAWAAARGAAWDAARDAAWHAAWDAAWDAARDAAWGAARATGALVAWDDMPAFIALSDPELEALRKIADGTDTAHKALFAQLYNIQTRHAR